MSLEKPPNSVQSHCSHNTKIQPTTFLIQKIAFPSTPPPRIRRKQPGSLQKQFRVPTRDGMPHYGSSHVTKQFLGYNMRSAMMIQLQSQVDFRHSRPGFEHRRSRNGTHSDTLQETANRELPSLLSPHLSHVYFLVHILRCFSFFLSIAVVSLPRDR